MEENSMEPSERLKALTARANDFPFDNKISLKRFVRTTKEMERMALVYSSENETENSYVLYLRMISLIVEKLPKHQEYKNADNETKGALFKKCKAAFSTAEKLKEKLKSRYKQEHDEYLSQQAEQAKELKERLKKLQQKEIIKTSALPSNGAVGESDVTSKSESVSSPTAPPVESLASYPTLPLISTNERKQPVAQPPNETPTHDSQPLPNVLPPTYIEAMTIDSTKLPNNVSAPSYRQNFSTVHNTGLVEPFNNASFNQNNVPNTSFNQNNVPGTLFNQSNVPNTSFNQNHVLNSSFNQNNVPNTSFDQNNVLNSSFNQNNVPNTSFNQSNVPKTSVNQNNFPSYTQPQINRSSKPNHLITPEVKRETKPDNLYSSQDSMTSVDGSRRMFIPSDLTSTFLRLASSNTRQNLETCGILTGKLAQGKFSVTHLVIPKQSATPDSCTTECEEELFDVQDKYDLITLGWIHTHPSQTSFLSSVDLHTQCSYQQLIPEAIAIVCAPKYNTTGIYRLTPNHGLNYIASCIKTGFHPHPKEPPLFEDSPLVTIKNDLLTTVVDLR